MEAAIAEADTGRVHLYPTPQGRPSTSALDLSHRYGHQTGRSLSRGPGCAVAQALVARLARPARDHVRIDIPSQQVELASWAYFRGLLPAAPDPLMSLDGRPIPATPAAATEWSCRRLADMHPSRTCRPSRRRNAYGSFGTWPRHTAARPWDRPVRRRAFVGIVVTGHVPEIRRPPAAPAARRAERIPSRPVMMS
jgi:hypothetical protein